MKNQYFGDVNDYRKYGLLRSIVRTTKLRPLVAWMLTPDDGGTDGKFLSYLDEPAKWSCHDPDLFYKLSELLSGQKDRRVNLIENTNLIPKAQYFGLTMPDSALGREAWINALVEEAGQSNLVFLDPDNGLEVKSRPYGRKNSSKYLYWREVELIWAKGKSLLIYQHFTREKRIDFIKRKLEALEANTPSSFVEAFLTPHVVFLMALQPAHQPFHGAIVDSVVENWGGQIMHLELFLAHNK